VFMLIIDKRKSKILNVNTIPKEKRITDQKLKVENENNKDSDRKTIEMASEEKRDVMLEISKVTRTLDLIEDEWDEDDSLSSTFQKE